MKKRIFGLLCITAIAFAGCDKSSSLPTRFTPLAVTNTNVKFLVMSPDAPQINFMVNGLKATAVAPSTASAVQGLPYAAIYPAVIGYSSLASGAAKIDAVVPAASTVSPGQTVFTGTPNFDANKFYTFALVDSLSRLSSVVVEDDPTIADATKAYIRVANFIPNGAVKVEVVKTSTGNAVNMSYGSLAFKSVSAFDSLGAGAGQTYRVYLRNSVTDAKLDSISAFVPTNTKKYTIYARGVLGQTGSTNSKRPIITNYINF